MLETNRLLANHIAIGGQVRIGGDLTTPEIQYIVDQHARYGMVAVDQIDRTKPYFGLCYAIDKPISVEKVRTAITHNAAVLMDEGRHRREEMAIAINNQIEDNNPHLQQLDLRIQEEANKHGSTPEFDEAITVTRRKGKDGQPTAPGKRQSQKRVAA